MTKKNPDQSSVLFALNELRQLEEERVQQAEAEKRAAAREATERADRQAREQAEQARRVAEESALRAGAERERRDREAELRVALLEAQLEEIQASRREMREHLLNRALEDERPRRGKGAWIGVSLLASMLATALAVVLVVHPWEKTELVEVPVAEPEAILAENEETAEFSLPTLDTDAPATAEPDEVTADSMAEVTTTDTSEETTGPSWGANGTNHTGPSNTSETGVGQDGDTEEDEDIFNFGDCAPDDLLCGLEDI